MSLEIDAKEHYDPIPAPQLANTRGATCYAYWMCSKQNTKEGWDGPRALVVIRHYLLLLKLEGKMAVNRVIKIQDIETVFVDQSQNNPKFLFKLYARAHEPTLVVQTLANTRNNAGGDTTNALSILRVVKWQRGLYDRTPIKFTILDRGLDYRKQAATYGPFKKDAQYRDPKQKMDAWRKASPPPLLPKLVEPEEDVRPAILEDEEIARGVVEDNVQEDEVVQEEEKQEEEPQPPPPYQEEPDIYGDVADDAYDDAPHGGPMYDEYPYGYPVEDDEEEDQNPYPQPPPPPENPPPPQNRASTRSDPPHVHLHLFMQRGAPSPRGPSTNPRMEIDDNLPGPIVGPTRLPEPRQPSKHPSVAPTPAGPSKSSGFEKMSSGVEPITVPVKGPTSVPVAFRSSRSPPQQQPQQPPPHNLEAMAFKEGFVQGFVAAAGGTGEKTPSPHRESATPPQPLPPPPPSQPQAEIREMPKMRASASPSHSSQRRDIYLQPYMPMTSVTSSGERRGGSLQRETPLPRQMAQDRALKAQLVKTETENDELRSRLENIEKRLGSLSGGEPVTPAPQRQPQGYSKHERSTRREREKDKRKTKQDEKEASLMRSIQNGLEADRVQNESHAVTTGFIASPMSPSRQQGRGSPLTAPGTATKRSPRRQRHDTTMGNNPRGKYWSSFITEWDTQNNY